MTETKIVHANVYDPSTSIFKVSKSTPAEYQIIECSLEQCPLRDAGTCAVRGGIFCGKCPYGWMRTVTGPTRRAASFGTFIRGARERFKGVPFLKAPPNRLAFVGDYAYLPYTHMSMCMDVPFLAHGGAFRTDIPFIHKDDWTIENVLKLVRFRPEALLGGEITDYQRKMVPLFVQHIRELDPPMFAKLAEEIPSYDVAPNYVGRSAYLNTLRHGISINANVHKDYPVCWHWDGEKLTTKSQHVYSSTWGGKMTGDVTTVVVPDDTCVAKIESNDWVTPETKFVD